MSNTLIYHTGCSISRPDWGCPSKARSLLALWKVWLRLRLSQLRLSQLRLWLLWQEGSCWTWTWTWNWTWRRRWQLRSWFWIWWPLSWIYWKQDPEVVIVFVLVFFLHFWQMQFQKYSKVYLAQKLNPLKLSLHCSAIFASIIPVVSSTGGWVVNSLSKLRVSVSLTTDGTNGGATVPWENYFYKLSSL